MAVAIVSENRSNSALEEILKSGCSCEQRCSLRELLLPAQQALICRSTKYELKGRSHDDSTTACSRKKI